MTPGERVIVIDDHGATSGLVTDVVREPTRQDEVFDQYAPKPIVSFAHPQTYTVTIQLIAGQ